MTFPAETDPRLLRLHPRDNVLTAIRPLAFGEQVVIDGHSVSMSGPVPLGHKLAACAIPAGVKVTKYGASIGSATRNIAAGEHVHTHNLKSDYLPTYLRDNQQQYFAGDAER